MNSIFTSDSYKMSHPAMLPPEVKVMSGNATPRSGKHAPKGVKKVLSEGQSILIKWLHNEFQANFFDKPNAVQEIKTELELHYGTPYDATHLENLHQLGYLPLEFKSLQEGVEVDFGIPILTWKNTHDDFAWLPLFIETPLSTMYWKIPTSATIALQLRRNLTKWAIKTDKSNVGNVLYQGHDFSARGMSGIDASWLSGIGHLSVFHGSDTLACIPKIREYYAHEGFISSSVPASEHSVTSALIGLYGELGAIEYMMDQFKTGFLSIVSDTINLWTVLTEYAPKLKNKILERDGRIVFRPDSGNPVDIICGHPTKDLLEENGKFYVKGEYTSHTDQHGAEVWGSYAKGREVKQPEIKGVVQLLWDEFGGTINEQGYKVLNPKVGAIYGDAINLERANEICSRLEQMGFASTNIVFGVGSYTYQFNTRDTFGFAMKATHMIVEDENGRSGIDIYKDPITGDGTKKSARGRMVVYNVDGTYVMKDQVSFEEERLGELKVIYCDGVFTNMPTFTQLRTNINKLI